MASPEERTLAAAVTCSEALPGPSHAMRMQHSHVESGFWLVVPSAFSSCMGETDVPHNSNIELTVAGSTNTYQIVVKRNGSSLSFSGGWRRAARGEGLRKDDAVVFEKTGKRSLRMHMFRLTDYGGKRAAAAEPVVPAAAPASTLKRARPEGEGAAGPSKQKATAAAPPKQKGANAKPQGQGEAPGSAGRPSRQAAQAAKAAITKCAEQPEVGARMARAKAPPKRRAAELDSEGSDGEEDSDCQVLGGTSSGRHVRAASNKGGGKPTASGKPRKQPSSSKQASGTDGDDEDEDEDDAKEGQEVVVGDDNDDGFRSAGSGEAAADEEAPAEAHDADDDEQEEGNNKPAPKPAPAPKKKRRSEQVPPQKNGAVPAPAAAAAAAGKPAKGAPAKPKSRAGRPRPREAHPKAELFQREEEQKARFRADRVEAEKLVLKGKPVNGWAPRKEWHLSDDDMESSEPDSEYETIFNDRKELAAYQQKLRKEEKQRREQGRAQRAAAGEAAEPPRELYGQGYQAEWRRQLREHGENRIARRQQQAARSKAIRDVRARAAAGGKRKAAGAEQQAEGGDLGGQRRVFGDHEPPARPCVGKNIYGAMDTHFVPPYNLFDPPFHADGKRDGDFEGRDERGHPIRRKGGLPTMKEPWYGVCPEDEDGHKDFVPKTAYLSFEAGLRIEQDHMADAGPLDVIRVHRMVNGEVEIRGAVAGVTFGGSRKVAWRRLPNGVQEPVRVQYFGQPTVEEVALDNVDREDEVLRFGGLALEEGELETDDEEAREFANRIARSHFESLKAPAHRGGAPRQEAPGAAAGVKRSKQQKQKQRSQAH